MEDRLGRKVDYLRLSLTSHCNLRCQYCVPAQGSPAKADELTCADHLFIVEAAARIGIRRVRLTGGEPLLVPYLPELIKGIAALPGIEDVSMTTNGLGLSRVAAQLKEAGLNRVNISLDSLRPKRYYDMTRGGDLTEVMQGITAALHVGLTPVKINCVIIGGFNDDELLQFAALTRDPGVSVRFIELMPFGECSEWSPASFVSLQHIQQELGVLESAEIMGGGPARVYRLPGAAGTIGFINGVSNHFCNSCNRLRVTSEGHVRPCLFSEQELDLLPAVRARSLEKVQSIMLASLEHKPDRVPVLKGKRMAEIGG